MGCRTSRSTSGAVSSGSAGTPRRKKYAVGGGGGGGGGATSGPPPQAAISRHGSLSAKRLARRRARSSRDSPRASSAVSPLVAGAASADVASARSPCAWGEGASTSSSPSMTSSSRSTTLSPSSSLFVSPSSSSESTYSPRVDPSSSSSSGCAGKRRSSSRRRKNTSQPGEEVGALRDGSAVAQGNGPALPNAVPVPAATSTGASSRVRTEKRPPGHRHALSSDNTLVVERDGVGIGGAGRTEDWLTFAVPPATGAVALSLSSSPPVPVRDTTSLRPQEHRTPSSSQASTRLSLAAAAAAAADVATEHENSLHDGLQNAFSDEHAVRPSSASDMWQRPLLAPQHSRLHNPFASNAGGSSSALLHSRNRRLFANRGDENDGHSSALFALRMDRVNFPADLEALDGVKGVPRRTFSSPEIRSPPPMQEEDDIPFSASLKGVHERSISASGALESGTQVRAVVTASSHHTWESFTADSASSDNSAEHVPPPLLPPPIPLKEARRSILHSPGRLPPQKSLSRLLPRVTTSSSWATVHRSFSKDSDGEDRRNSAPADMIQLPSDVAFGYDIDRVLSVGNASVSTSVVTHSSRPISQRTVQFVQVTEEFSD